MAYAILYRILELAYNRKTLTFGRRYGGDGSPGC